MPTSRFLPVRLLAIALLGLPLASQASPPAVAATPAASEWTPRDAYNALDPIGAEMIRRLEFREGRRFTETEMFAIVRTAEFSRERDAVDREYCAQPRNAQVNGCKKREQPSPDGGATSPGPDALRGVTPWTP